MAVATVDVWRLAVGTVPPGKIEQQRGWKETGAWRRETGAPGDGDEWRLAAGRGPPGVDGACDDSTGAWRLAVCDARQAVWTQCPPSDVGRAKRFWFSDGARGKVSTQL